MPDPYLDLETKPRPLAGPLPPARPGDWLPGRPARPQWYERALVALAN
jgi:hypothetical protein